MESNNNKLDAIEFYAEYIGHRTQDLTALFQHFQNQRKIYLCGDSSMDNKHWFFDGPKNDKSQLQKNYWGDACNGYEKILNPPRSVKDIAYWLNYYIANDDDQNELIKNKPCVCINAAIEESSLGERSNGLREQDQLIADNLTNEDVIVVSVGGNDVALKPNQQTMQALQKIIIASYSQITDNPPGIEHLINLFGKMTQQFLEKIVKKNKPKFILLCMLYNLDENSSTNSWTNDLLKKIRYDEMPSYIQSLIKKCYIEGTKKVKIDGVKIIPVPMFEILDGKDTNDYEHRVEPSVQGGQKLAKEFWKIIKNTLLND